MTRATFDVGAKMRRIEKNLDGPRAALRQIGASVAAESRRSFREQKHGRDRWQARAPVNVYGIIADFSRGGNPPSRRFETRPALRDTGRLANSIAYSVTGAQSVEIGTNLNYGHVLHSGGPIESERVTAKVQRALSKWLRPKEDDLKDKLAFLLSEKMTGKTIKGEVPARPFVGITRQTRKDIRKAIGVEIMEVR